MGFSILFAVLPIVNIFIPLANAVFFYFLSIASLCGLMIKEKRDNIGSQEPFSARLTPVKIFGCILIGVLGTITLLFFTRVSNGPITNYDSYLYHLGRIEYYASERFVVGIGNIHSRFAFPSNHFALSAFLEGGPLGRNGFRYLNSFVAMVTIVQLLTRLRLMLLRKSNGRVSDWILIFGAGIVTLKYLSEPSIYMSSPSPDFIASLLTVISFVYVLKYLESAHDRSFVNALIVSLGASMYRPIGVAVVVLLVVHMLTLRSGGVRRGSGGSLRLNSLPRMVVSSLLFMFLSFAIPSVLSSGSLLYPSPSRLLVIEFLPWSIDYDQAASDLDWIRSWARAPGLNPVDVLGSWEWLTPWWHAGVGSAIVDQFWAAFAVISIVTVISRLSGWRPTSARHESFYGRFWLLLVGICPALTWFLTSPALRFGWGALVVLIWTPLSILLLFSGLNDFDNPDGNSSKVSGALLAFSVILVLVPLAQNIVSGLDLRAGFPVIGEISETPPILFERSFVETVNDTSLIAPVSGDQCGRVKWCTPYDTSGLKIRQWSIWTVVSRD